MPRRRFSVDQIINLMREADVLLAQGQTVLEVCRGFGVSEQSYYCWRLEYVVSVTPIVLTASAIDIP